jgi:uncharacterized protein (DUF2147 family)
VIQVFDPEAPDPLCERCNGELKDKPVVGMTILRGLRWKSGGYRDGTILDPDDGRTYSCTATLLDGGRALEIRGYVAAPLFGRSEIWRRAD